MIFSTFNCYNQEMIQNLERLLNSKKHEQALSLVTCPNFYRHISNNNMNKLINLIEGKVISTTGNQKLSSGVASIISNYPPSIIIALYSVIVVKCFKLKKAEDKEQNSQVKFNHKYAIEILSKLYNQKQLANSNKEIIAALLLRIDTFSNHRMIVRSITPKYIQEKNMIEWSDAFKKQVPVLFQDKWKQFKSQWPSCSPIVLHRDLANDFQELGNLIFVVQERFKNYQSANLKDEAITIQQLQGKIAKDFRYILSRICTLKKTDKKINIDSIFKMIEKILGVQFTNQKDMIQQEMIYCEKILTESKNFVLKLLIELLRVLGKRILPKIKQIYQIILNGLQNKQLKTDLILYIKLFEIYMSTFGDGSIQKNRVLFQSQCSVQKLMDVILNCKFEQKVEQQLNFQRNKKQQQMGFNPKKSKESQIKHKQDLILNIGTNIHHHFQAYINKHSALYRQTVLGLCLFMMIKYYQNVFHDYKNASKILELIENGKNRMSAKNQLLFKELKSSLFSKNVQIKPNFQYFCEQVFNNSLKNKQSKQKQSQKLSFVNKITNVCINPISLAFQNSQSKYSNGRKSNLKHQMSTPLQTEFQSRSKVIKRTKSYEMQGWENKDDEIKLSKDKSKGSKQMSDMFYSIKQCSAVQEGISVDQQNSFQSFTPASKDKISKQSMKDSFKSIRDSANDKKQQNQYQSQKSEEKQEEQEGYLLTPEF